MKHHLNIKKSGALYTLSVLSFFLSLHVALPSYFNSSFLTTLITENGLSIVYSIQSVLTIIGFLMMHSLLRKFGNFKTSIALLVIQIFVIYGIITMTIPSIVIILFVLSIAIVNMIGFTLDIFLEENTNMENIGTVRGHFLTAANSAWILGPLIGGVLIFGNNYNGIYIAAILLLFPIIYIIFRNFKNFIDPKYAKISLTKTISAIFHNSDISNLIIVTSILNIFYAWMVIYTPIYLNTIIGFSWDEIGIIFTIMLIPFVLIETPLGRIADKKLGEKEIMIAGYIIMGLATISLSFITGKNLLLWAGILFVTRIGAAAIEIMIETYFFKKVDKRDTEVLGIFRVTRPIGYIVAPLLSAIGLLLVSEKYLFIILGVICLLAIVPLAKMRDTA